MFTFYMLKITAGTLHLAPNAVRRSVTYFYVVIICIHYAFVINFIYLVYKSFKIKFILFFLLFQQSLNLSILTRTTVAEREVFQLALDMV